MEEVQSLGGSLICVERRLAGQWRGIDGISIQLDASMVGARTDYDCLYGLSRRYLSVIRWRIGAALIFGDVPTMITGVLKNSTDQVIIWQVLCANEDEVVPSLVASLGEESFGNPVEATEFAFNSSRIVIFDSALPGEEGVSQCVSFNIEPGGYLIATHRIKYPSRAQLVLHRFHRIT